MVRNTGSSPWSPDPSKAEALAVLVCPLLTEVFGTLCALRVKGNDTGYL